MSELDGSFVVSYDFITKGNGLLTDQVHEHVWYPLNGQYNKYLLNDGHVIVVLTYLGDHEYRIDEPSGSRPWEGIARLENNHLQGSPKFRNSEAQMNVEGTLQPDGSFDVSYDFITDDSGQLTDETQDHRWVPANS